MNKPTQFTQGPRIERTPGNWTVQHNNNDDTTYIVANDPRLGADMVAEIYRVSAYEGNAALIAAAPAMYEALQAIEARLQGVFDNPALMKQGMLTHDKSEDVIRFVQTALAQAEGRQA